MKFSLGFCLYVLGKSVRFFYLPPNMTCNKNHLTLVTVGFRWRAGTPLVHANKLDHLAPEGMALSMEQPSLTSRVCRLRDSPIEQQIFQVINVR